MAVSVGELMSWRVGGLFFCWIGQVFCQKDEQQGKDATEENAKQGLEEFIEPENFQVEERKMVNQYQEDRIVSEPFHSLVFQRGGMADHEFGSG